MPSVFTCIQEVREQGTFLHILCPNSQALDMSTGSNFSHLKKMFLDSDNWEVYRMILVLLRVERPGEVQHVLR